MRISDIGKYGKIVHKEKMDFLEEMPPSPEEIYVPKPFEQKPPYYYGKFKDPKTKKKVKGKIYLKPNQKYIIIGEILQENDTCILFRRKNRTAWLPKSEIKIYKQKVLKIPVWLLMMKFPQRYNGERY